VTSQTPTHRPAIARLASEFADRDREDRFRHASLPEWRERAVLAAVVGAIAFALFGVVDGIDLGWSRDFYTVLAVRCAPLAIVAALAIAARLDLGPRKFYWIVFAVELCFIAIYCAVVVLVPQRTNVHVVGTIAMILFFYLFVPTRAVLGAVAGATASVAFVAAAALWTPLRSAELIGISIIFGTVNLVGTVHVIHLHRLWRQSFAARETERETTERLKKRSRQLAKARDAANHANRAKSEFLAHMSHELRTPLNAINGFSEIIKDEMFGPVAPRYREYATDIHRSGMHLTALINDVLDLSKIEAGKLEMEEENIEPAAVVESCLHLVRDRAHKASLRLLTDMPSELPTLKADERLVKQMLLNLLTNAIKFTPEGGRVVASVRLVDDGRLAFAVSDTGIGIAAEDLPKVLEPYGQVATARDRNPEGTGLGLPLVKKMVGLHGGTLSLDSAPGVGTTATLAFPSTRTIIGRRHGADDAAFALAG
jgi:signal transduction histidine kinase